MNFKQLEYFSAVAEAKSISMAARKLHVAQPPVSRQISMLEDELGVCLFLRNNKGIELTEAGRCLYEQSQQMFQNLRMMADSVRDVGAGVRGQLKIGIIYSNIPVVMDHLREFHEQYPQVELYIRLGAPTDLLDDLNRGKLHVLFLRSQTEEVSGLREKVLGEDPLELVMTADTDPAPGENSVPIQALKGVPMCLLRSDDLWGYSNHLINECERKGVSANIVCQCYDTPMAMQMVQAGFGVSFLPRSIVGTHPNSDIYAKPIEGIHSKSYPVLVWSDDIYYASCVKQFIAMARATDWNA
ncbi:LysR family transcriptional regulator [Pseudoflavonifractor phocaeensis]|uniref:LysR family transcriptional regulator n=1 Tax=Pseudoflavonifractor phocaeensis TaxID=1870988 RepID=UPI001F44A354|nr:LysR family transcriptional regulator [Pseudoflavonifractor phocaeensis]MCF2596074.1 LysR family transcriptional regulator [Pseudoflavonifractor phocaeensis]MDY3905573.1 LysR family transcriptional regulator [Lawsonibacter sp.]